MCAPMCAHLTPRHVPRVRMHPEWVAPPAQSTFGGGLGSRGRPDPQERAKATSARMGMSCRSCAACDGEVPAGCRQKSREGCLRRFGLPASPNLYKALCWKRSRRMLETWMLLGLAGARGMSRMSLRQITMPTDVCKKSCAAISKATAGSMFSVASGPHTAQGNMGGHVHSTIHDVW